MFEKTAILSDTVAKAINPLLDWGLPDMSSPDSSKIIQGLDKATSAAEIFSASSSINPEIIQSGADSATVISHSAMPWQVAVFLSVTLAYYIYVLYRYWNYMPTLFRVSTSINKTLIAYETKNNEQIGFEIHSKFLLILALSTTIIEFTQAEISSQPTILLYAVLATIALLLYKFILIKIFNAFSDEPNKFKQISIINGHTISLAAIIYTPIVVAAATNLSQSNIPVVALLIFWFFYIIRLLNIFMMSGFGKLQWFLYLCTVEILPVSYLLALAVRF